MLGILSGELPTPGSAFGNLPFFPATALRGGDLRRSGKGREPERKCEFRENSHLFQNIMAG